MPLLLSFSNTRRHGAPHRDAGLSCLPYLASRQGAVASSMRSAFAISSMCESPNSFTPLSSPRSHLLRPLVSHFLTVLHRFLYRSLHYLLLVSFEPSLSSSTSSRRGVFGKMEMEEIADKNDVEVDVLAKNPSLRSHQRFPRDEAVLARFGKQQQFRVSPSLQLS